MHACLNVLHFVVVYEVMSACCIVSMVHSLLLQWCCYICQLILLHFLSWLHGMKWCCGLSLSLSLSLFLHVSTNDWYVIWLTRFGSFCCPSKFSSGQFVKVMLDQVIVNFPHATATEWYYLRTLAVWISLLVNCTGTVWLVDGKLISD